MPPQTWPEPWHVVVFVALLALGALAFLGSLYDLWRRAPGPPEILALPERMPGPDDPAPAPPPLTAIDHATAAALVILEAGPTPGAKLSRELLRRQAVWTSSGYRYVVQRLVDAGLVVRTPAPAGSDDVYSLTSEGRELAAGIAPEDVA